MPLVRMSVAEPTLGSLRGRWNEPAENFIRVLGFHMALEDVTWNSMAGSSRKLSHEEYSKFLAAIAFHAGVVKAKGGSFDEWLHAVERLSEWRQWNSL